MKTNQASSTAKVIAASTILLASDARTAALVAPGAAQLCKKLLSADPMDRLLAMSAEQPFMRALWRIAERLTLPGIMAHYWHRKHWIENRCRHAIAEGFKRLIVLGAGFDTLGYRLSREFSELDVIEVDHPATQGAKQRALAGDEASQMSRLHYLALDLNSDPLPLQLFDNSCDTVIVIEAVLIYLPEAQVNRLFAALSGLAAKRVRILFSFITKWPDGRTGFRPYSWLVERWLAWRNESFAWALAPSEAEAFLAKRHFKLLELALTNQIRNQHGLEFPSRSILEGENLILCERI